MNKIFTAIFLTLVSGTAVAADQIPSASTDTDTQNVSENITHHTRHHSKVAESTYERGLKQEADGDIAHAMKSFHTAANMGYGPAMKKLTEIYDKGNSIVPRNYETAIKWFHKARDAGINFPPPRKR